MEIDKNMKGTPLEEKIEELHYKLSKCDAFSVTINLFSSDNLILLKMMQQTFAYKYYSMVNINIGQEFLQADIARLISTVQCVNDDDYIFKDKKLILNVRAGHDLYDLLEGFKS